MSFLSFCFVVLSLFCLSVCYASHELSSSSSLTDLPIAFDSLSLTKAYSRSSHLARRRHLHRPRFRVGTDGKMFGSLFLTYLASVEIDGEPFSCIMDTGSSDFAVAATKDCGCKHYYHGKCDGVELTVAYGDGNWTGRSCSDSVKFGTLNSGPVTFAGMFTQVDMLECSHGQNQNGIIGLAYPGLLGPPANYTLPFMYSLTSHNKLPLIFGMQCCGWSHHQPRAFAPVPHQQWTNGALDIGGVRQEHYSGPIYWSDIYEQVYYAVDVLDVRLGNQSISPLYKLPHYRANPVLSFTGLTGPEADAIGIQKQMIVDSGTSDILLTPVIFDTLVAQLKQLFPTISDKVWSGDACLAHHDPAIASNTWPDITFTLTGTVDGKAGSDVVAYDVMIPPCRYMSDAPVSECDNGIPGFAFSVERADPDDDGNIMGQAVFEAFYIIHDLEKHRIGFSMIEGCSRQSSSTPGHNLNFHEMRCSAALNPVTIQQLKERFHQTKHSSINYLDNAIHTSVLPSSNLPLYSVLSIVIIGAVMIVAMRYVPSLYRDMKGYQSIPSSDDRDSAHGLP